MKRPGKSTTVSGQARLAAFLTSVPIITAMLAILVTGCGGSHAAGATSDAGPQDVTTTFTFNQGTKTWDKTVDSLATTDGTSGSDSIVVQLNADEPVNTISLEQVLLTDPSGALLRIAGQEGSGVINICDLTITNFEAEQFDAEDVEVMSLTATNVQTKNALNITVDPTNVVRCSRGGDANLSFGVAATTDSDATGATDDTDETTSGGLTANSIEILGPSTGDGFVETISVDDSSVFGSIELKHLRIQNLTIDTLTVQN